jgi:hypothetical protein
MNLTNHFRRGLLAVVATTVGLGAAGTTHADTTPTAVPLIVPAAPTPDGAPLAAVAAPTAPRSVTARPATPGSNSVGSPRRATAGRRSTSTWSNEPAPADRGGPSPARSPAATPPPG